MFRLHDDLLFKHQTDFVFTDYVDIISKEEFAQFDSVVEAFIALQAKLSVMLRNANFLSIKRACINQQKLPLGIKLPEQLVAQIYCTNNTDALLDVLVSSPYCSWIEIRLIKAIVRSSGIPKASLLLENYESAVFSMKLIDVLPNNPNTEIKEVYYSKIVAKLDKEADSMTVSDLLEFRSQMETVILDIGQGECILDHIEQGCIQVHFYVPTDCVARAYHSASGRHHYCAKMKLIWIQIESFDVIHASPTKHAPNNDGK